MEKEFLTNFVRDRFRRHVTVPPTVILHILGSIQDGVFDRVEMLVLEIKREKAAASADPGEGETFGTQVVPARKFNSVDATKSNERG